MEIVFRDEHGTEEEDVGEVDQDQEHEVSFKQKSPLNQPRDNGRRSIHSGGGPGQGRMRTWPLLLSLLREHFVFHLTSSSI